MAAAEVGRNPYIIGRPIDEPEKFFGRESLFNFIEDNLNQNVKVIPLYGQRRIGKSSVLKQIPNFVRNNDFVFVSFDLQDKSQLPLSELLHNLATEIVEQLHLNPTKVLLPNVEDLAAERSLFYKKFLSQVYRELGDKKLVLLLDEFDVLSDEKIISEDNSFFSYLTSMLKRHEKLFIIPIVGGIFHDLPNLWSLFKGAPFQSIGFLDEISAKRLITKPAEGILEYQPDAIQAILKLSAGHPYFTQVICFTLFSQARTEGKWMVTRADVESIADKAIELAEGGLAWFWDGLTIPERVVFSFVAEAQKIAIKQAQQFPEDPLRLLENYGVIQTDSLKQAVEQLIKTGFLDHTGRSITIELVRDWLVQRYPLRQEIWELENVEEEEVNHLLVEVAPRLQQQGKNQNAIAIYKQILALNPNHFSTIVALAEEYLKVEDFDNAIELYTRAYQIDPISNKKVLFCAMETYGHRLVIQGEFKQAKEQYNRVLEIEPDKISVKQRLAEIAVFESISSSASKRDSTNQYGRRFILQISITAATVSAIIAFMVLGVYRVLTPCLVGEQKILGMLCVADPKGQGAAQSKISRGERTLFPTNKSQNRDQGIEAFKKGDYSEAAQFFKNAVADSRNDPEVLIYYNNARSQQQGSPLTLAAVVPVDNNNESAQEMLRGVAQAQNQFNQQGGFNGRLLEIVIANDGNEPERAKQVAQALIKDSSVVGVIGHNSSEATQAALGEYKKAHFPIVSPTSTSSLLAGEVFFRTTFSDAVAGKKLAEYARKTLNLSKVVILYNPKEPYSNGMREEFTKNFELLGGKIAENIDMIDPNLDAEKAVSKSVWRAQAQAALLFPDTRHTSVALDFAKANADLIASPTNQQKRGLKLLAGNTLYSPTTLTEGGQAVEGLILAVPWFREAPQSKNFAQVAAKQWGGPVSWRTATSFDATQAFIKALSSTNNPSRSTVLQGLQQVNLSSSETSGEALQFTPEGERPSEPFLVQVVNGKFVLVQQQVQKSK